MYSQLYINANVHLLHKQCIRSKPLSQNELIVTPNEWVRCFATVVISTLVKLEMDTAWLTIWEMFHKLNALSENKSYVKN